jgi:hypothetical protein
VLETGMSLDPDRGGNRRAQDAMLHCLNRLKSWSRFRIPLYDPDILVVETVPRLL